MRALTSASGMPRAELSRIQFGQFSDSVNTARSASSDRGSPPRTPAHRSVRIDERPWPEPLSGELGGGDRSRVTKNDKEGRFSLSPRSAADGGDLADAGRMEPGQAARRPFPPALPQPLTPPGGLLLAVPLAKAEQHRHHRPRQARQRAVGFESEARLGAVQGLQSGCGPRRVGAGPRIGLFRGDFSEASTACRTLGCLQSPRAAR